jgi:hypothetical protein
MLVDVFIKIGWDVEVVWEKKLGGTTWEWFTELVAVAVEVGVTRKARSAGCIFDVDADVDVGEERNRRQPATWECGQRPLQQALPSLSYMYEAWTGQRSGEQSVCIICWRE